MHQSSRNASIKRISSLIWMIWIFSWNFLYPDEEANSSCFALSSFSLKSLTIETASLWVRDSFFMSHLTSFSIEYIKNARYRVPMRERKLLFFLVFSIASMFCFTYFRLILFYTLNLNIITSPSWTI